MLEQHIGADVFRDGVRTYLKAHAYGNTVTTDLWDALENASGEPVRDVMDTFILQGGHPLVSLRGRRTQPATLRLRPGARGATSSIGADWHVPVAVRALGLDGEPGAPSRHLVLDADPEPIAEAKRADSPSSMPAAGACSGSATRRRTERRWRSLFPSSPPWSGPT